MEITYIWMLIGLCHGAGFDHTVKPKCGPEATRCEFSLSVENALSMMVKMPGDIQQHRHPLIIYPNGTYVVREYNAKCMDDTNCDDVRVVDRKDISSTVTLDGSYKMLLTVNGQTPGPTIVVYQGQEVVVNVTNAMFTGASMTMHWHGQHQMGTPWMDGAGSVSQCPIEWGESFLYRFIAHPVGNFWYHAHLDLQRTEGVIGGFVVLPRPGTPLSQALQEQNPLFNRDYMLFVQDMYSQSSTEVSVQWRYNLNRFTASAYDDLEHCFKQTYNVDGRKNTFIQPKSILLNGKGWHYQYNTTIPVNEAVPLESFLIGRGEYARFRVVNSALALTLRVSVDSHTLTVLGTDSTNTAPRQVESIIIAAGERYDFWIQGTDPDGTGMYWIRAEGIGWATKDGDRVVPMQSKAILYYEKRDQKANRFPNSSRQACTQEKPCELLNCPYRLYPPEVNMICVPVTSLRPTLPDPPLEPSNGQPIIEKFVQFYYAQGMTPTIAKKEFLPSNAPPQIYPYKPFAKTLCLFDEDCMGMVCPCTNLLKVPTGRVVQLVFRIMAHGVATTHPVHLHGHSFQIVKIGYPEYDPDTAEITADSVDILCPGDMCVRPFWSNSSWNSGELPGVADSLIRKDTIAVPVGGYVAVRIFTNNPGFWLMHCHMEIHSAQGMDLILQEGQPDEMPPTPERFKTCGNFYWTEDQFTDDVSKYYKDVNIDY